VALYFTPEEVQDMISDAEAAYDPSNVPDGLRLFRGI